MFSKGGPLAVFAHGNILGKVCIVLELDVFGRGFPPRSLHLHIYLVITLLRGGCVGTMIPCSPSTCDLKCMVMS